MVLLTHFFAGCSSLLSESLGSSFDLEGGSAIAAAVAREGEAEGTVREAFGPEGEAASKAAQRDGG